MSDMCKVSRTQPQMGRMDQLRASHMTWGAWRNTQATRSHTRTTHSYKLYSRCRYEKFVNNRQEHHSKWEEMAQLRAGHTTCDAWRNTQITHEHKHKTHQHKVYAFPLFMSDMYKASTTPHKMGRMDQLPASHTTCDACINTQMTNEHSPKTHQYKVNAHPLSMSATCKASTTPHNMDRNRSITSWSHVVWYLEKCTRTP